MNRHIDRLVPWLYVVLLLFVFGLVGKMDYRAYMQGKAIGAQDDKIHVVNK